MPHLGEFTKEAAIAEQFARIKTGEYTGDGTTSHAITGIGFRPKYVRIWPFLSDGEAIAIHETTDNFEGGISRAVEIISIGGVIVRHNRIISLDADGFTVSDAGANIWPNANGVLYSYLALG